MRNLRMVWPQGKTPARRFAPGGAEKFISYFLWILPGRTTGDARGAAGNLLFYGQKPRLCLVERGMIFPVPRGYRAAFALKNLCSYSLNKFPHVFPFAESMCVAHRLGPKILSIKKVALPAAKPRAGP
jgi:hypothetical protein